MRDEQVERVAWAMREASDRSGLELTYDACEPLARAAIAAMGEPWRPIESAPTDRMFVWAAPNGPGKWSLGLAYRNVSGTWSDAYGARDAPTRATLWADLPAPPVTP